VIYAVETQLVGVVSTSGEGQLEPGHLDEVNRWAPERQTLLKLVKSLTLRKWTAADQQVQTKNADA
jgi:hypothetical protein